MKINIDNIKDYFAKLKQFWHERHLLGEQKRQSQILDFMPAALEIQETPPSPMGKLLGRVIMLLFSIAVLWALLGKVDIIVVADGKIVPAGKVKIIQSAEEGVVKNIFVRDGQLVNKNEPLIEMDATYSQADKHQLELSLVKAKLNVQRIRGELGEEIVLGTGISSADFALETENQLFAANQKAFLEQIRLLGYERDQAQAANMASRSDVDKLKTKVAHFSELLPKREKQAEIGLIAGKEVDDIRFRLKTSREELAAAIARSDESNAREKQAVEKLQATRSNRNSELYKQLSKAEHDLLSIEQELVKAKERVALQILKAPVSGVVQQLAINTVGGYISRGQSLMVIVPEDTALELNIKILDKDIGFVNARQPARIKVHAFEFTRYGMLEGELQWVGSDAVVDELKGPVYPATIALQQNSMPNTVNNRIAYVSPGMGATVDIVIGKRRLIEYFLSPLLRYKNESLKER